MGWGWLAARRTPANLGEKVPCAMKRSWEPPVLGGSRRGKIQMGHYPVSHQSFAWWLVGVTCSCACFQGVKGVLELPLWSNVKRRAVFMNRAAPHMCMAFSGGEAGAVDERSSFERSELWRLKAQVLQFWSQQCCFLTMWPDRWPSLSFVECGATPCTCL